MARDSWYKLWREAYIDLHAAYLGVLRLRHHRKKSNEHVISRDMGLLDPFGMDSASGSEAVRRWYDIWEAEKGGGDEGGRVMAAASRAIQSHWKSWAAFMELCPPDLRRFRIQVPYDTFVTSTAVSRGALEQRAKVLSEAWRRHLKGEA